MKEMELKVDKLVDFEASASAYRDDWISLANGIAELASVGTPREKTGIIYAVLALVAEMELVRSELEEIGYFLRKIYEAMPE